PTAIILPEEIMKKFGILIFIVTILAGVVFASLFSFGRVTGKLINFSFGSKIKGSAVAGSETRSVTDFKGIDVGGVFRVEVTAGQEFSLEVEADDNLLPYIKTKVDNGVLHIETTQRIDSQTPMVVRVSAPDITSVEVSGVAKVELAGVKNSSLEIDTSGASKLKIEGETSHVQVEVSGSSSVDAESLKARTAAVDASGASHVSIFVTERLVSDASGASQIAYSGDPTVVEKQSSGASSVYKK
ncbi:MAG: head GIN domain-containing protein, partial [Acidobacteriota bacterium]